MRTMAISEMTEVTGGTFWSGFACAAGVILTIATAVSPEPVSKLAFGSLFTGTVAACGVALT